MGSITKERRKEAIHAKITSEITTGISVLDMGKPGYLTFRIEADERVTISAGALDAMLKDLCRHNETMGFLLGYTNSEGVSFVRYAQADLLKKRGREFVIYKSKDYLKMMRKFRREGYDAQADLHNHPYEKSRKIPIKRKMRGHDVSYLLRHGVFVKLEKSGRLSKADRKSAKRDHRSLKEEGINFERNFSGVLSTYHIKHVHTQVKVLLLYGKNGSRRRPIGIEMSETGE